MIFDVMISDYLYPNRFYKHFQDHSSFFWLQHVCPFHGLQRICSARNGGRGLTYDGWLIFVLVGWKSN